MGATEGWGKLFGAVGAILVEVAEASDSGFAVMPQAGPLEAAAGGVI